MMKSKQRLIVECEIAAKECPPVMAELQQLIIDKLTVMDGHAVVTFSWESRVDAEQGQRTNVEPVRHSLSGRQFEIAMLLCKHHSIRKIASLLHITENTVKKHIQNIKHAYGLRSAGLDFLYELQSKLNEEQAGGVRLADDINHSIE